MKTFSLLKAVLSQDMNLFKYKAKSNSSKLKKMLLPISLFILLGFSVGFYAYGIADLLKPMGLTYVMLTLFLAVVVIFTFMEGIYKSQDILFTSKDNDLLFSLPIRKGKILFVRLIKFLLFEYLYNLMFILPALIVYIYFEHPGINFYLMSILITILIPIIPTILSGILGYIVKLVSSKMKHKRLVQIILTGALIVALLIFSSNTGDLATKVAKHATSINDFLTKVYYPIGAYISLIEKFDIAIFIKLLLINIIPLVLFVLIGQKYYFRIISNFKSGTVAKKKVNKVTEMKVNKPLVALTKKELKRYFSSIILMFNTIVGPFMIAFMTAMVYTKGTASFNNMAQGGDLSGLSIEAFYFAVVGFALFFTSISSSSISLEGKTINITKTLPIKYKMVFDSKILMCLIVELPITLISEILFIIKVRPNMLFIVQLLLMTVLVIFFNAVVGIMMNLKYPKLNASNDTEIVKQSMSSTLSLFIGFGVFALAVFGFVMLEDLISVSLYISLSIVLLFFISLILYKILLKKGPKKYQDLNV